MKDYSTNTLEGPENAFVDIQGRVIAFFSQHVVNQNEVIVVIEKAFEQRVKAHLSKYLPLFNTRIETAPYRIYHDLDTSHVYRPGEISIAQKKGALILTNENYQSFVTDEEYRLFRLKYSIPVQGEDFDQTLLLNVANEERVSYTKGCYLGQEIIARVHYKGKPPKALVVKAEDECTPDGKIRMTSKTTDPSTGKVLGFLFIDR